MRPLRILYRIEEEIVLILAVIHGRRNMTPDLLDETPPDT